MTCFFLKDIWIYDKTRSVSLKAEKELGEKEMARKETIQKKKDSLSKLNPISIQRTDDGLLPCELPFFSPQRPKKNHPDFHFFLVSPEKQPGRGGGAALNSCAE